VHHLDLFPSSHNARAHSKAASFLNDEANKQMST
jgi:hypothetical protein